MVEFLQLFLHPMSGITAVSISLSMLSTANLEFRVSEFIVSSSVKSNSISVTCSAGVIKRDELVFTACRRPTEGNSPIPLVMVTSGGYQRSNAVVIANSIVNLHDKGFLNNFEHMDR